MKRLTQVSALLAVAMTQSACVAVGYSSRGGWFLWPGGFGLVVLLVLLYLIFGRGR